MGKRNQPRVNCILQARILALGHKPSCPEAIDLVRLGLGADLSVALRERATGINAMVARKSRTLVRWREDHRLRNRPTEPN